MIKEEQKMNDKGFQHAQYALNRGAVQDFQEKTERRCWDGAIVVGIQEEKNQANHLLPIYNDLLIAVFS